MGAPAPWRGLLLAYGVGQLAANLPITPGGLGVVEGSLTITLVALGGSQTPTVAAVLLYRILSFWAALPAGYAAWGGLVLAERHHANGGAALRPAAARRGLAGILAAWVLLAAACTEPRNALGTSAGPCFRALPVAAAMVHHRGTLVGMRRPGAGAARRAGLRLRPGQQVCLVAYRGRYGPGLVERPVCAASGGYAIAVVSLPGEHPLATIVRNRPPRFRRR